MSRRRFLAISAAALAVGGAGRAGAETVRWRGLALGAVAEITLRGPRAGAERALRRARGALAAVEAEFSLYREGSALQRLNAVGQLTPSADFAALMTLSDRVHRGTGGRFDPTVQPLWHALATGGDVVAARQHIGWERVRLGQRIALGAGQALTFNGIAQGFATDRVSDALGAEGFGETLVNIGEFRAGAGDWRVGIVDPLAGLVRAMRLRGAIATSSPRATEVGGAAHILSPRDAEPVWSTVSVEASEAALADGLSTAFCLMRRGEIGAALAHFPEVTRVTLVDEGGDIAVLSPA